MLESSPLSILTSPAADAGRPDAATSARAGGATIEIFHSFHALVDALSSDADGRPAAGRKTSGAGASPDAEADAAPRAKDASAASDADSTVVPLDIAALLGVRPQPVPSGQGGTSPAPGDAGGHHVWTAADLAALLARDRAATAAAAATPGDGATTASAGADASDSIDLGGGDPTKLVALSTDTHEPAGTAPVVDAALLQIAAQRMLGVVPGAGPLGDLGSKPSAALKLALADLQIQAAPGDQTSSTAAGAASAASRLAASFSAALGSGAGNASVASEIGGQLATAGTEVPSADSTDAIIRAIRMKWAEGGGDARIELEPRQFGDMTVSVSVRDGQVVARLQADAPIAREWLQANQHVLRQGLADHQLTLARLDVSEPSSSSRQGASGEGDGAPRERQSRRRSRTPDADEPFEIVA